MNARRILVRVVVLCAVAILVAILAVRLYCHWSVSNTIKVPTLHVGLQTVENHRFNPRTFNITDKGAKDKLSQILLSRHHRFGLASDVPVDADEYAYLGDPSHDSSWLFIFDNIVRVKTSSGVKFQLTYDDDTVFEQVKGVLVEAAAK
jgi:hypothetical protein